MSIDKARSIWDALRAPSEGYLDAQARVERERALTAEEQEAADVLFRGFLAAMQEIAKLAR